MVVILRVYMVEIAFFFSSVHCVRGMYCLIFRVTVLAQADVESDAVEENVSVMFEGFGYEKAIFQISQLPLSQTNFNLILLSVLLIGQISSNLST